jgi:hypothetical protein
VSSQQPSTSTGPPEQIYIIRHGEKPADPASPGSGPSPSPAGPSPSPAGPSPSPAGPPFGVDVDGSEDDHSLIPRGWQRSGALAVLFAPALGGLQSGLEKPGALFSPSYGDPGTTQAHRTYETIAGLAERLGLDINSPFPEGEEPALASSIVSGAPGVVLVCWEHQSIPALATALPSVPGSQIPPAWPGDRFDVIWSFTAVGGAQPVQYSFSQIPQQLLGGDTDTVI